MTRNPQNRRRISPAFSDESASDSPLEHETQLKMDRDDEGNLMDLAGGLYQHDRDDSDNAFESESGGTPVVDLDRVIQNRVIDAIVSNTQRLERIQAQLDGLCEGMVSHMNLTASLKSDNRAPESSDAPSADPHDATEITRLHDRIDDLQAQLEKSEQHNSDLESQLSSVNVRETVETIVSSDDALSWEDRKRLILQQMEDDDFDSDDFAESVGNSTGRSPTGDENPADYVQRLNAELARRDQKIQDLQHLLEQQAATTDSGVSIGAAGIAGMIDSDELVREERERLKQLQTEWEEKFRQSEIEASLERAKLSRERRELASKQAELERELERVRLKTLQQSEKDGPRKWLSQLGLSGS